MNLTKTASSLNKTGATLYGFANMNRIHQRTNLRRSQQQNTKPDPIPDQNRGLPLILTLPVSRLRERKGDLQVQSTNSD